MRKASVSMRTWYIIMGAMLWTGIYFTGFSTVNWLLFLPAAGLTMAGVLGFCPTWPVIFKLTGDNEK